MFLGCGNAIKHVTDALASELPIGDLDQLQSKSAKITSAAAICCRIGTFHFGSNLGCRSNLDQISLADAGTTASGMAPKGPVGDQFGPKREEAALGGLNGVDGAAVSPQESTLAAFGFAESEQMFGAVDVASFEFGRSQFDEGSSPDHVLFGEIDVAVGVATFDATLLTSKAQAFFHVTVEYSSLMGLGSADEVRREHALEDDTDVKTALPGELVDG